MLAISARRAFRHFLGNDPLRLAGATAFFTTFALPPILLIIIQLLGLFFKKRNVRHELFQSLENIIGKDAVEQIITVLKAFRRIAINQWMTVFGFIFLLFIATTLFKVVKNSINQLWQMKSREHASLWNRLSERLAAMLVIVVSGVLFVAGLFTETLRVFMGNYIGRFSSFAQFYFNSIAGYLLVVLITTLWFTMIFRYLPDGRPKWRVALAAGLVTGILFNFGKFLLHYLLVNSNIGNIYGPSGSIVLLLLFVFYSSFTVYYGACFAWFWGRYTRSSIKPSPGAKHYQVVLQEIA